MQQIVAKVIQRDTMEPDVSKQGYTKHAPSYCYCRVPLPKCIGIHFGGPGSTSYRALVWRYADGYRTKAVVASTDLLNYINRVAPARILPDP